MIETIQYAGDPLDYDQRGPEFRRILGDSVDIGAYEGLVGPETSTYVVSTLVDESDGNYSAGDVSLREAIYLAGQNAGHELITFDAGLSGTIELSIGQLQITSDMTIQGPGAGTITIDANGTSGTNRRVFYVLTLTGGYTSSGGAVYSDSGSDLAFSDLVITGNHATNVGGGIYTGWICGWIIRSWPAIRPAPSAVACRPGCARRNQRPPSDRPSVVALRTQQRGHRRPESANRGLRFLIGEPSRRNGTAIAG